MDQESPDARTNILKENQITILQALVTETVADYFKVKKAKKICTGSSEYKFWAFQMNQNMNYCWHGREDNEKDIYCLKVVLKIVVRKIVLKLFPVINISPWFVRLSLLALSNNYNKEWRVEKFPNKTRKNSPGIPEFASRW